MCKEILSRQGTLTKNFFAHRRMLGADFLLMDCLCHCKRHDWKLIKKHFQTVGWRFANGG